MPELELHRDDPPRWLVFFVLALCVALGAWLALAGRADMLLYGDEYLSISNLDLGYAEALASYDNRGTGVGFLLLQKLSVDLFGAHPIAYRLPAMLGALGALCLLYPVGRRLVGGTGALIAVPLLATASTFVYYSRFGRTYSILIFLMLVYVWGVERLRQRQDSDRCALFMVAISGGLLPWFHLTSSTSVAVIGLLGLWQLRAQRAQFKSLLLALVAGALLCLCLMLPAWASMRDFFEAKLGDSKMPEVSALDVVALFLGTRLSAAIALGLCGVGIVLFPWRRPAGWLLLLAAALTPLFSLLLTRPSGLIYAFARYQISALPFLCLGIGWSLALLLQRLGRAGRPLSLALGLGLALQQLVGGPILYGRSARGPFSAVNLSMLSLPPFDTPWDLMPAFYRRLAELDQDVRILELPEQVSRSALLYRNYWLTHQKDVSMGFMITDKAEKVPGGPHVNLRAGELRSSNIDYVVYHKRIQDELTRYWLYVLKKCWDQQSQLHLVPYIKGLGDFGARFEGRKLSTAVLDELGKPFYEDHFIQVWKLK